VRSHPHVTVALDDVLLAETHCPVLLFETGLPARYYVDRSGLVVEHLKPSDTTSLCPHKGVTTQYRSAQRPSGVWPDIAWAYDYPFVSRRNVGPAADYHLGPQSSAVGICWVAAHDARSARPSAVGVRAAAV